MTNNIKYVYDVDHIDSSEIRVSFFVAKFQQSKCVDHLVKINEDKSRKFQLKIVKKQKRSDADLMFKECEW